MNDDEVIRVVLPRELTRPLRRAGIKAKWGVTTTTASGPRSQWRSFIAGAKLDRAVTRTIATALKGPYAILRLDPELPADFGEACRRAAVVHAHKVPVCGHHGIGCPEDCSNWARKGHHAAVTKRSARALEVLDSRLNG